MQRYFSSIAEAQSGVRGWSARTALAAAKQAARDARRADPEIRAGEAARREAREEMRLSRAVVDAEEGLATLERRLASARASSERMMERTMQGADIQADAAQIRARLDMLPRYIERARIALASARDALEAHRATMARYAAPSPVHETVEDLPAADDASGEPHPDLPPMAEPHRGRGRPKKNPL